ncbi:MAG: hypothetical protein OEL53_09065 [Rhodospirillales bacterium]|nr:hypothetical protein [Rhodospirillales bacterium]
MTFLNPAGRNGIRQLLNHQVTKTPRRGNELGVFLVPSCLGGEISRENSAGISSELWIEVGIPIGS